MTEEEIRAEIAANVLTVASDSSEAVTGNVTTIDIFVIVTVDASGNTKLETQRIHIVNRGGGASESATYGGRRHANYVAPAASPSNAEFFLANAAGIVGSITNAAGYELAGDLTEKTESLPVRIKNAGGQYINSSGAVDASGPRYLVMRIPVDPGWTLLPYNPSDSVV